MRAVPLSALNRHQFPVPNPGEVIPNAVADSIAPVAVRLPVTMTGAFSSI